MNVFQALASCIVALFAIHVPKVVSGGASKVRSSDSASISKISWPLFKAYLKVAISNSAASPFGYASLKHINFPTLILGKSCKLLPVMLMNFLVYRRKFEWFKYVSVAMITAGVSGFMMFDPSASGKAKGAATNSLFGLLLVLINLLLDGCTNSWQDVIFKKFDVSSFHMMFYLNLLSSVGAFIFTLTPWSGYEFFRFLEFCSEYPSVIKDLVLFSFCGSLGQVFIYGLLAHFGSLTLVTVTVTRKLFTVLLSVFWFSHPMAFAQWIFVALVFSGIALEAFMKVSQKSPEKKILHLTTSDSLPKTTIGTSKKTKKKAL